MRRLALGSVVIAMALAPLAAGAEELALGAPGPQFTLVGTDDKKHSLADYIGAGDKAAPATVLVFTCNHCPFSQAYEPVLIDLANDYAERGIKFVAINPNDAKVQPEDSFDKMKVRAKEKAFPFDYLHDATQEVAKAYGAAKTPHVFMLDAKGNLVYRGRINDAKDQDKVQVHDLRNALDAVLAGKDIEAAETKAFGCSIKWKKTS
jgi:thiol-disulfide isomerase/thioredoxin